MYSGCYTCGHHTQRWLAQFWSPFFQPCFHHNRERLPYACFGWYRTKILIISIIYPNARAEWPCWRTPPKLLNNCGAEIFACIRMCLGWCTAFLHATRRKGCKCSRERLLQICRTEPIGLFGSLWMHNIGQKHLFHQFCYCRDLQQLAVEHQFRPCFLVVHQMAALSAALWKVESVVAAHCSPTLHITPRDHHPKCVAPCGKFDWNHFASSTAGCANSIDQESSKE